MGSVIDARIDDPRLAVYLKLTNRELRRSIEAEAGVLVAESALVVAKALACGLEPLSLLVARRRLDALMDLVKALPASTPVFALDDGDIESITGYRVHRGVLGAFARPRALSPAEVIEGASRLCVLEASVDATNVGAIFRSAAALGADGVLLDPTCADPYERRCLRTSMGCVLSVPWARFEAWPGSALDGLRAQGFTVASCALSPDAIDLATFSQRWHGGMGAEGKIALVFGTEGEGLAPGTVAASDVALRIPMARAVDSLNVGAAAAIFLWELFRSPRGGTGPLRAP